MYFSFLLYASDTQYTQNVMSHNLKNKEAKSEFHQIQIETKHSEWALKTYLFLLWQSIPNEKKIYLQIQNEN